MSDVETFIEFTRSKICFATPSGARSSPVPATSQRPDWAMFHKPVFAESYNPSDRNKPGSSESRGRNAACDAQRLSLIHI